MRSETALSSQTDAQSVSTGLDLDSDLPPRRRKVRRRTPAVPWTLYRYVGIEVLRIFLVSLLVISLLGTVVLAFQLTRSGVRLGFIWPVLQKSLAYPLFFSLPLSLLFSVTLGVGRLAADLELSAMKANGLSQLQIAAPIFLLAVVLSGTAVYINGEVIPVVHYEKGNLRDAIIAQLEDLGTGRNRSLLLPGHVRLFVEDYERHRLRGIRLELPARLLKRLGDRIGDEIAPVKQARDRSAPETGGLTLFSRDCELEISPDRARIFLNLRGVEILAQQRVSTQNQTDIFRQKYSISNLRLPLAFLQKGERVKDRSWSQLFAYAEILEENIGTARIELAELDEKLGAIDLASAVPASAVTGEKETNTDGSAVATPAVTSPSISVMAGPTATARLEQDRRFLRGEINSHVRRQNRADTEIHRRVAFSLACFSFLFVGLPFVFLAERRSRLVPFFYTNVFVVLPFFLLVMLGVLLGERGYYPAVALAIPNVLLLGAGAYLWSRVLKR